MCLSPPELGLCLDLFLRSRECKTRSPLPLTSSSLSSSLAFSKAAHSCVLFFYPAPLLKVLSSLIFRVTLSGDRIMTSILPFTFLFPWLTDPPKTSSTTTSKSEESGHPVSSQNVEKMVHLSPFCSVGHGFVICRLHSVEECFCYSWFLEGFYHEVDWTLLKAFYVSTEAIMWAPSLKVELCAESHIVICVYWTNLACLEWDSTQSKPLILFVLEFNF